MDVPTNFSQLVKREAYLLNHLYSQLESNISRLAQQGISDEKIAPLRQALEESERSWPKLYKMELMLIDYLDETDLTIEWERRLADVNSLSNSTAQFYTQQKPGNSIERLRGLTRSLISDLQWVKEVSRVRLLYKESIRRNIVVLFLLSFIIFFMPTVLTWWANIQFSSLRLYYIFTAASAGFMGASFSQLSSLNRDIESIPLDQLRAMSKAGYIIARAIIGAGAGLIMFYILQAGLIEGVVFPEFIQSAEQLNDLIGEMAKISQQCILHTQTVVPSVGDSVKIPTSEVTTIHQQCNPVKMAVSQKTESIFQLGGLARPTHGLSMLIVWCLIAGFIEKLIPNLLLRNSEKVTKKVENKDI